MPYDGRAMTRTVHALQFEFDDGLSTLIVWPDRPAGEAHPFGRGKHWLDVRAGDEIVTAGQPHRVSAVKLYLVFPTDENGRVVESGRAWLRDG